MPTRLEFEMAAEKFSAAADLVGQLASSTSGIDVAQILQGGSLGRQVPERIAAAEHAAVTCQSTIIDAVETCIERAGIIADYEVRLGTYDTAHGHYMRASRQWSVQFNAWFLDETGTVARPGARPRPPTRPPPPPAWAEVRRP